MKSKIDFKKIAMTTAGGAMAGASVGLVSRFMPNAVSNPIVKASIPAIAGLAIEFLLPKQKDLANGAYGASGYTLGQVLMPQAMNGTFSINGSTNAINGRREEVLSQLLEAKKHAQLSANNFTSYEPVNGTSTVANLFGY